MRADVSFSVGIFANIFGSLTVNIAGTGGRKCELVFAD